MSLHDGGFDTSRTLALPSAPQSPGVAGAAVRGMCTAADVTDEASDTALLLTSELVTNTYQHGEGAMLMSADVRGDQLRVSVTDTGEDVPAPAVSTASGVLEARGRGLAMVAALATRWGIKPRTGPQRGKAVWFELEPVR